MAGLKSAGDLDSDKKVGFNVVNSSTNVRNTSTKTGGGQGTGKVSGGSGGEHDKVGLSPHESSQFDQMAAGFNDPAVGKPTEQPTQPTEQKEGAPNQGGENAPNTPASDQNAPAPEPPKPTSKSSGGFDQRMRSADERNQLLGHNKPGMSGPDHQTTGPASNRQHTVGKSGSPSNQAAAPKTAAPAPAAKPKISTPTAGGFVGGLMAKYGAAKGYVGKNKKGFAVGGGIAGFLATLVMGFFALLPLKIEAMMKAVYGEQYARVEHAMERRTEKMVIKYALQNALNPEGGIVATGNPLGDLYKTWRVQQSEGKLFEQEGLKIEKGSSAHSIRVTLGDGVKEFGSGSEFEKYLQAGDLKGRQARQFIKTAVRSQTHWYQFLKRRHLRRWISNAYGVRKWSFFKKNESAEDTRANFDRDLGSAQSEGYLKRLGNALGCIMTGNGCPSDTPATEDPGTVREPAPEGQQAADAAEDAAREVIGTATSEEAGKTMGKALVKLLGKAIPIIGWIDLGAHVDDFIWNRRYVTVVTELRKVQYADVFATWAKIADQIKDGSVTAQQVNEALKKLDTMEKSRMFQELFMAKSAGQDVPRSKDLNLNPVENAFYQTYRVAFAPQHYQLTVYLHTLGWVVEKLGDLLSFLIGLIPGVKSAEEWIADVLSSMLDWLIGPVITGKDLGLAIGNAIRLGADIISNEFMSHDLGGVPISPKAERETLDVIAQERRDAPISLQDRLFSTDDPSSFVSRLAVTLPSSPMVAVHNGFDSILAMLSNPLSVLGGGLQMAFESATNANTEAAGSTIDRWGVPQSGYTEAMLNADIDLNTLQKAADKAKENNRTIDQVRPEDCPDSVAGQPNYCKIDVRTIQILKAPYTNTDNGGFNSDPIGAQP